MELLAQQLSAGLASGAIYACVALALVMIYQAIGHVNFAQGEMAMFSTFLGWQLMQSGLPYWAAFVGAVVISFVGGIAIDRLVFKPIRTAAVLSQIVMFVGLLAVFEQCSRFHLGFTSKPFPSPFGADPLFGSQLVSTHQATMVGAHLPAVDPAFYAFLPVHACWSRHAVSHRGPGLRQACWSPEWNG